MSKNLWGGAILLAILCLAATVRLHRLTASSFWLDEFFTTEVATGRGYWFQDVPSDRLIDNTESAAHWDSPSPSSAASRAAAIGSTPTGGVGNVLDALVRTNHPPLYFLLLHGWIALLGSSDLMLRGFSVLCSLVGIALAFDAMRSLHGIRAATGGAMTMAVALPQVQYAQEARAYALLIAVMLCCCAALARIQQRGINRGRLIALFVSSLAMLLTHYLGAALFTAIIVYAAVRLRGRARHDAVKTLMISLLLAGAMWGPFLWMQRTVFAQRMAWMHNIPGPTTWLGLIAVVVQIPVEAFGNLHIPTNLQFVMGTAIIVLPLLLRRRHDLLLWWLILVASIGVVGVGDAWRGTNALLLIRYTLPATVAAYVIVAVLLSSIPYAGQAAMACVALFCFSTLSSLGAQARLDWRPIAQFMATHCHEHDVAAIYRADDLDSAQQTLLLGIRHYAPQWDVPVVLLDRPATPELLATLRGRGLWLLDESPQDQRQVVPGYAAAAESFQSPVAICSYLTPEKSTTGELAMAR